MSAKWEYVWFPCRRRSDDPSARYRLIRIFDLFGAHFDLPIGATESMANVLVAAINQAGTGMEKSCLT